MRSSDREIVQFLDELIKLSDGIVSSTEKAEIKDLIATYYELLKEMVEWPHHKQVNLFITLKLKNINLDYFVAYLNDLPVEDYQFLVFKKVVKDPEAFILKQIKRNKLAIEAMKYFYKSM